VEPPIQKIQPARDLLLSLDLSQSMDTRDYHDTSGQVIPRVEAVRQVVSEFVARRTGDRIGLVVFGDAPYPEVPFTLDHTTVQAMIEAAVPGMAGPRTALGDSMGLAIKMFEKSHAPERVLIVLTDGNDTASKMPPDRAAGIAKDNGIRIHTVGIGDPKATGEDKLDTAALQKIAETTGGRYFFGGNQSELEEIYRTLDQITPANQRTLTYRPKRELFYYPLGLGTVAIVVYQIAMLLFTSAKRVFA
jgi:Ca-activated chloride channel family protein